MRDANSPLVIVAIAAFRRPRMLERLLRALESIDTIANVCVLVADNDAQHRESADLCGHINQAGYRWPIEALIVPERGIAQARNALFERAMQRDFDYIAILDDDEWPESNWLDALLATQRETNADALHGGIVRVFDRKPGPWTAQCVHMADIRHPTGPVDMIAGTGNTLIARRCLESMPTPYFDPKFALTGGEDRDFFTRLKQLGFNFAWADNAIVYEHMTAARTTFKWALTRAYRIGNSDMRVFLKTQPDLSARLREYAKIAGAVVLLPAWFLLTVAMLPERAANSLFKFCRAAGKTAALFGRYHNEYAVVHGA